MRIFYVILIYARSTAKLNIFDRYPFTSDGLLFQLQRTAKTLVDLFIVKRNTDWHSIASRIPCTICC